MPFPATTCNAIEGGRPSAPLIPVDVSIVGPNPYAAGGIAGFAAAVQAAARVAGLKITITKDNIFGLLVLDGFGYQLAYDKANDKLKFYTGDNDNVADGPAVEVGAVSLAAVTFRVVALVA